MNSDQSVAPPRRGGGLFWPILLIGLGTIFLLSNLGLLPANLWVVLWQLWPVLLIVLGLEVLLSRRSAWGGTLGALLALLLVLGLTGAVYAAQSYPSFLRIPELRSQQVEHPLAGVRQAEVTIDFPGGRGSLTALGDSQNLIEGEVTTYGDLRDDYSSNGDGARVLLDSRFFPSGPRWFGGGQERWAVALNPSVAYDLKLDGGSGSYEFDLGRLNLRSLAIHGGSGQVRVTLPESGQYRFKLDAGSGSVDVRVPEGVAVRVEYDAGSGSLNAPGLRRVSGSGRDGVYESPGFSQSGPYVVIDLDGGSGSVSIR